MLLEDLESSITYMKSIGFSMNNNRYKKSFSLLKIFTSESRAKNISVSQAWSIAELLDFSYVVWILREKLEEFSERIPQILDGGSIDAESKTTPRDIFFELKVIARLKSLGAKITELGTTDVAFTYCERDFALECKRVQSEKKIRQRIEGAQKQMQKKSIPIEKSIVALDLSKLVFKYFAIEEQWPPSYEYVHEVRDRIEKKLIVEHIKPVIELVECMSFLFCHFRLPVLNSRNEIVMINHFFSVSDRKTETIGRRKLLRALRPSL